MRKKEKSQFYLDWKYWIVLLLIGVALVGAVYGVSTWQETQEADSLIQETLDLMKQQCIRYDSLVAADETTAQIQLLDKASELERCLVNEVDSRNKTFLEEYRADQRLSGIIWVNTQMELVDMVTSDGETFADWAWVFEDQNVEEIPDYPAKKYISRVEREDGAIYDYVAISVEYGQGVLLCYVRQQEYGTDKNQIDMENLFAGYQLKMDGILLVTDGERILSSNMEDIQQQEIGAYPLLADNIRNISSSEVTSIQEEGVRYLVKSSKSTNYNLYIFYPASAVYRQRWAYIAYALILYVLFILAFIIVQQQEVHSTSQMKMRFLRQISHDIRTPINGIRGMVMIGNRFPEDTKKQQECRDKIWEASNFLIELINDVLDVGKMESGEIHLEEKPFNMRELVEGVTEIMTQQAKDQKVTMTIEAMEGEHWDLIGSPLHIRRIISNIISNAIKYNRENGAVRIYCRELGPEANAGARDRAANKDSTVFEFICEDTGLGMSREFQKHMFEQFKQENVVGEQSYHGTGLGLTIVHILTKAMKGTIQCKSERNEGTTFTLTLPLQIDRDKKPEVAAVEETAGEVTEPVTQGLSILLVEDNEMNMEIAEFILTEEGARITKAVNGKEAVDIFAASAPGEFKLILMDIMMPVMDGEEATREIRKLPREDAVTVPIIAMTANAFNDDIQSAIQAGMNGHLAKPIDLQQLRKLLREYA